MLNLKRFTEQEFDTLATQMRLHASSASRRAMHRVLVDGESLEHAAIAERYLEHHLQAALDSAKACVERAKVLHRLADN